jgi:ubiquinone/menaquinone biosynthesis C-methylase UbiE
MIHATSKTIGKQFCPFRKEKQMDYLFSFLIKDFKIKGLRVLDACCGYGRLIHFLNEFDPKQFYVGIDYVQELIDQGKEKFSDSENVSFICYDVRKLSKKFKKEFDISINYKTLSWLSYYEEILSQLVKVSKRKIYLTSLFCDGDIDFITKVYQNTLSKNVNCSYLNTYSFPKFEKYCHSLGAKKINSIKMKVDFDLPKPKNINKLQTYTVLTQKRERIEITGSVILNWRLVEIVL